MPGSIIYHSPQRGSESILVLDGVTYHRIDTSDIPSAVAEVPVTLDERGKIWPVRFEFLPLTITYMEIKSRMFAGLTGASVSDSGQPDALGQPGTRDQLSPAVGWSFFSIQK